MSYFTPADAAYIKSSVRKIMDVSEEIALKLVFQNCGDLYEKRAAELARLEAFIDGCTLEKGKE